MPRGGALTELDRGARARVRSAGLIAAILVALLLAAAGALLRQPLFDLAQNLAPPPRPTQQVVVVAIDAPSLAAVGGWPWSRYTMARLTEQIAGRGARAIGFDFLFPEPDRQAPADFVKLYPELSGGAAGEVARLPSMDAVFARVIGRSPVVLARAGVGDETFDRLDDDEEAAAPAPLPPDVEFQGPAARAIPVYPTVVANLDILDGAALGHGLANGPPDTDGVIRRVPLLGRAAGALTPSLALDLVRVGEGESIIRLEGTRDALSAIRLGRHRVPVDAGGRVELRFAAQPQAREKGLADFMTYSAADLLRQGVPANAFEGKLVLVGLTAAGTSDVVTTPRAPETYGVFVQAQAVDAILRSAALERPAWAPLVEWGVGLALVLLAWFAVPRLSLGQISAIAAVEIGAAFAAGAIAFQQNLILDPLPMLVPGAATSGVMIVLLFVEGRRVQTRLRGQLEDERLSAARISGELAAASEIQSGMLMPRAELARVSPAVEIDAALQSAKTVGGDLYDAFPFDDGRVCFLVGDVTGKGVPASLFMALSKALSRSLLMRPATPLDTAIEEINRELSRDNRQAMAVSLLVGVLHPGDGRLDLVSAGHENPLVVGPDRSVRELRLDGGPALCVADDFPYPVETHTLAPGETLVFFTDGLTEAQAPDGSLFDRDQMLAAVSESARVGTLTGMVDGIVSQVRLFEAGSEPTDDLTVLAVRLKPAA
ncbi:CHASE2 domain-containing protein [Phenylobacterium sp.]|uniref:CHASE2 domain-containing protein n=1 Tax=Phenylobacterium sp. TaxID=1871053 RepID=UPI0025E15185|nr:CHASE2 domain-containing protein [Phenylobacterium sp.]MBX3485589.1 CHASE2 domain-containing protein [Phenylobacterium sp.]MCW5758176.1 CHASE2 domain-containing protein [Phenylobacterium sp.]